MIDDKKIEEACDKALKNSGFNTNDVYPYVKGFYDCAKWAINEFLKDLWHPANEEPEKRNENIIVLQDEDESNPLYAAIVHARHDKFPWDEYCEDNTIYKWCYFKEIAPKKGDEQ